MYLLPAPPLVRADARDLPLADSSVDCIITSPPYYKVRDYGMPGQIGHEVSMIFYVNSLMAAIGECRRVLKETGSLWLNIGDVTKTDGSLYGIPGLVSTACLKQGWLLQSEVVWSKAIGSPSGGSKRPLRTHEAIFVLSLSPKFYYDADAIREPLSPVTIARYRYSVKGINSRSSGRQSRKILVPNPAGRYSRSVWHIVPTRYKGQHFAAFSEPLVARCMVAGCPPDGVVLDPFIGSGTVGIVARRLGRRWVGIDLGFQAQAAHRYRTTF